MMGALDWWASEMHRESPMYTDTEEINGRRQGRRHGQRCPWEMKKDIRKARLNNDKADSEILVGSRGMWDEPGAVVKGHNLQCSVDIIYKSELYPKSKGKQEKDIRTQYLCMCVCVSGQNCNICWKFPKSLRILQKKKILLKSTIILI